MAWENVSVRRGYNPATDPNLDYGDIYGGAARAAGNIGQLVTGAVIRTDTQEKIQRLLDLYNSRNSNGSPSQKSEDVVLADTDSDKAGEATETPAEQVAEGEVPAPSVKPAAKVSTNIAARIPPADDYSSDFDRLKGARGPSASIPAQPIDPTLSYSNQYPKINLGDYLPDWELDTDTEPTYRRWQLWH